MPLNPLQGLTFDAAAIASYVTANEEPRNSCRGPTAKGDRRIPTPQCNTNASSNCDRWLDIERSGSGFNRWTPIWVVRVGDDLYARSGFGKKGLFRKWSAGKGRAGFPLIGSCR
jgi:hypothetical protein